ncbi:MAG: MFS transporter [Halobacteriales archaeon]|nr:MFS transporter [Halobacteriales archaeon]
MSSTTTADETDTDAGLLTGYSGRIVLLVAFGWFSILLGRQALPPLLPTIIEVLRISPARAGVALTVLMGLYSLLQYPAGRLSDALSRTTLLIASIGGMILGFGLLGTVTNYPQLLAGAAVLGVSSSFYFTPSRALLSDLFVERRGQAFGIQTTAGMGGAALAAGVAVGALRYATWQAAFLPTIVLLVGVGILLHRWSHEPYVLSRDDLDFDFRGTVGRLLFQPRIRRLLFMRALTAFTFQGIVGFLPTFLQVEKGFSTTLASASFALVFVVGSVMGPLAGRLSDLFPRLRVVLGALFVGIIGLLGMLLGGAAAVVIVSIVAMSMGLASLFPVMGAYFMDLFPDRSVGGDFGAAKTVFSGLGSIGPTYVGIVAASRSYTIAFAGLLVLLVLAVGVLLTLQSPDAE